MSEGITKSETLEIIDFLNNKIENQLTRLKLFLDYKTTFNKDIRTCQNEIINLVKRRKQVIEENGWIKVDFLNFMKDDHMVEAVRNHENRQRKRRTLKKRTLQIIEENNEENCVF